MLKEKKEKEANSAKKLKTANEEVKEITLEYKLHELPSSQHKSGLAGLVLMVRWLTKRNPHKVKGILEELECTDKIYKLRIDKEGMKSLFDETYSASWEEQERDKPLKNSRTKEEIPYKRKETKAVDIVDKKTGENIQKEKEIYIYDVVVPSGSFLKDMDNSQESAWIKLWRDMIWNILRGIPTTRIVYENRASKEDNKDYLEVWNNLIKITTKKSEIQGTYFLSSQDKNAEGVPFLDQNKNFLLLHFWPFISQIYIPQKLEYDNSSKKYKPSDDGFAICIPEILDLKNFCLDYEEFLKSRDNTILGFRPRASKIFVLQEAGWDSFERLKISLTKLEGAKKYSDLVNGIDVFRFIKEGNNINNKANFRIRPDDITLKEYEAFKNDNYFDSIFKRQILTNLSENKSWHEDFGKLFKTSGYEYFIGKGKTKDVNFSNDVNKKFKGLINSIHKEHTMENSLETDEKEISSENLKSLEQIIYWMIRNYISIRLASKYGFKKEDIKTNKYVEMKEKLAKETFLAIRSRTGGDFISYFSSSICSVGQYMNEERFLTLTKALFDETDKVRTLSMLALSAVSYTYQKKETSNV
ncbi:type I-MYXAN CRISPR-associated protein Cmx8 [Leptospira alstonii]|uniref:type I-MYXAN CRISPR-associated protein Cmx8 n=1 Tax=Leptospira alstonii TaxID=28452 RepID=UPI0007733A4E|nr:type I-MYXAN CRISPR-associated protein Cmx8 [Leptospira alstonii]